MIILMCVCVYTLTTPNVPQMTPCSPNKKSCRNAPPNSELRHFRPPRPVPQALAAPPAQGLGPPWRCAAGRPADSPGQVRHWTIRSSCRTCPPKKELTPENKPPQIWDAQIQWSILFFLGKILMNLGVYRVPHAPNSWILMTNGTTQNQHHKSRWL